MNDDERKEELLRFAKAVGDACAGITLALVAIAAGAKEAGDAFEKFADAMKEPREEAT